MHRITMTYASDNPHTGYDRVSVEVDRDGGLEHFADTFRAFMVAAGFDPQTVDSMIERWVDEIRLCHDIP